MSSDTAEYPFFDFVDDILTELVLDPLSSKCFNGLFDIGFRPKTTTMVVPEFSNLSDYYYPATIESNRGPGTSPSLTLDYRAVNLSDVPANTELFDFGMDPALSVGLNEFLVVGAELQELEHWDKKFQVAGNATEGYFSKRWISEHVFGMSEDEFLRNQREMFFDKKFGAKLEAAA